MRRSKRLLAELEAEIRDHIEREMQDNIDRGMHPDEARRAAHLKFGNISLIKEETRSVWTWVWLDTLWQDLRLVVRRLRREPGFALVAMLTLTLAVGANTAILGVADAVLFRPLPYAEPERVFIIQILDRQSGTRTPLTPYAFVDAINDLRRAVSTVGMTGQGLRVVETTPDGPRAVPSLSVSANYFRILGVTPARGRIFDEQDAGNEGRSAMLSYAAWQDRFAHDTAIAGKSVSLGNTTFDIVGVLPEGFVFPSRSAGKPDVITAMNPVSPGTLGGSNYSIVRIAPGVSQEQAQAQIEGAVASLAAADPDWRDSKPVLDDVRSVLYGGVPSSIMRFLMASATLILLIGSANLANMLLVRGHRRTRETAMRLALGARSGRLIRPILLEAIVIGVISGGVAVVATASLFDILLRQIPPVAYGVAPVGINPRVAFISLAISLVSALTFAVIPVWRAAHLDVLALLQGRPGKPGRRAWLGRPMVVAQVALSVVAVFGAVVAARAFVSILKTPLGFLPDDVVRISVMPPPRMDERTARVISVKPGVIELADPPPASADRTLLFIHVLDALRAHPDVLSAGASTGLPLGSQSAYSRANLPGTQTRSGVGIEYVLPGFFETIGMTLRSGRTLTWDDLSSDPGAAVIAESAARTMFGGSNPLGKIFLEARTNREFHIVGVVADARQSLDRADSLRAYVFPSRGGVLVPLVRVRAHSDAILSDLKATVRAVTPESLVGADWWTDSISGVTSYRNPRFQTIVLGAMGLLALGLTALGVFGVVNYLVISRTREMGVRLAIGASPQSLMVFVLKGTLAPVLMGLVTGVLAIRWIRPLAEAQLYKVDTHDPPTLAISAAAVALAALVAAYLPARRASAVDPVRALRSD